MKSQRDSSFPADGHKAILNKKNNKSKTNKSERILTIRIDYNRSTALERSVINYLRGLNRFYERSTSPWVLLWFIYTYKLFGPREELLLISESKQWTYKSRFITEMKQEQDLILEQQK